MEGTNIKKKHNSTIAVYLGYCSATYKTFCTKSGGVTRGMTAW